MKRYLQEAYGTWSTFAADMACNLLGAVLYSAGVMLFARASAFALGGLSGVSLLINRFTGFPVGTATLLLDIPLILFSWRVLGRGFLLKSAFSTVIMTGINDLVISRLPSYGGNTMLAALYCGALMGAGLGIIYSRGSSTGGTDFLVLPAHRLLPRFTLPQLSIAMDAVIILAGGLVYGNVDSMLYGIVSAVVCSAVMDRVVGGTRSEKMAIIITDQGLALAARISDAIGRGATVLQAVGAYTGNRRDVLLCVCSRQQVVALRRVVHAADPAALVMITEVTEAYGEGFRSPDKENP